MSTNKLKLGVNIDHVATLREARGEKYPDVTAAARVCEQAGAEGITVHLREDRRHIQDADVYALRQSLTTRLNLEMADVPEIVAIALDVNPDEVCLVPEKRAELTTEGGLDVLACRSSLRNTVKKLSDAGIMVSLFVDPDPKQLQACREVGAPCVELHTGTYCNEQDVARSRELERLRQGARLAHELGLQVNAGHGLNLENLDPVMTVPWLDTLNIGHSIVAMSIFVGLDKAVQAMISRLAEYSGGQP